MATLLDIVEGKFCPPHWIFLREFRNGTGFTASRSADALAVGLYQSRGQLSIGFEVKISRSDWLRELRDADKAEEICKFCDHWNILVPDISIVHLDELPTTWGLIVASGQRLKTIKSAPRLPAKPVSRNFMASIIKRAVDSAVRPYITTKEEKVQRAEDDGFERGKQLADRAVAKLEALQAQVRQFESSSGIQIAPYQDMRKLGDAVRAIMSGGDIAENVRRQTQYALNQLKAIVSTLEREIDALDTLREKANGKSNGADQAAGETAAESGAEAAPY
jgi:exonuclease VII small subunit